MKSLYTAATGMAAQQVRIENIANNLANVSTVGFKKGRESFEDLVYQQIPVAAVDENGRPAPLEVGSGTRMVAINRDFQAGSIQHTGQPFDLAIAGEGFFVVEDIDGVEHYTRDGQLTINNEGELVTHSGHRVSPGVQIPDDIDIVSVTQDGTIVGTYNDTVEEVNLGTLRMVRFVNPSGLHAQGGKLFSMTAASGEPLEMDPDDGINIQQGFLESSNVDVAEELVNMIIAQRAFELTSKVIQAGDETMQTVVNLKR